MKSLLLIGTDDLTFYHGYHSKFRTTRLSISTVIDILIPLASARLTQLRVAKAVM
jgi:hypothetical protein